MCPQYIERVSKLRCLASTADYLLPSRRGRAKEEEEEGEREREDRNTICDKSAGASAASLLPKCSCFMSTPINGSP